MEAETYSRHIFIFPFQWDYIEKRGYASYNERTDIKKFGSSEILCDDLIVEREKS